MRKCLHKKLLKRMLFGLHQLHRHLLQYLHWWMFNKLHRDLQVRLFDRMHQLHGQLQFDVFGRMFGRMQFRM